jgi:hypothetical protein
LKAVWHSSHLALKSSRSDSVFFIVNCVFSSAAKADKNSKMNKSYNATWIFIGIIITPVLLVKIFCTPRFWKQNKTWRGLHSSPEAWHGDQWQCAEQTVWEIARRILLILCQVEIVGGFVLGHLKSVLRPSKLARYSRSVDPQQSKCEVRDSSKK